ncbi:MAG TPA: hypothetical protein VKM55_28185 [Candidatus Lokiarchaeia archaeon]|nr:hypothetical protein [Candidatus Lokiarchaeia archaeon]
MRDEVTLNALAEAKKFMFDLSHEPATIIAIPGNYAIQVIRDAITPEDVQLWVEAWNLDLQLSLTGDHKICVWLKSRPVSKQKKHKASVFQTALSIEAHG